MLLSRSNDIQEYGLQNHHTFLFSPLLSTEELLKEAEKQLAKNPTNIEALLQRTKALIRIRDYHSARTDLSFLLDSMRSELNSEILVYILFYHGVCNVKLSLLDEAIADFTAVLDINSFHKRAAYERAACHNRKGNFTAAILDYEKALQQDINCVNYLKTRNAKSRFAKLRWQSELPLLPYKNTTTSSSSNIVQKNSSSSSSSSFLQNTEFINKNEISKRPPLATPLDVRALQTYSMDETIIKINNPNNTPFGSPILDYKIPLSSSSRDTVAAEAAELHHQRGLTFRKRGELKSAIEEYTSAIKLDPKNFKALFNRGFCYDKIGSFDLAISDYKSAMKLEPGYAYTYYNLGICYDRRGDHFKEAISMFSKAITLDGNNADFYHNRGFSQRKLSNYNEAIKDYTKALSIDPQHFKAYYNRAFCFDKLGEISNAIEDYTNAISIHSDNSNAYHNRGAALEKIGRIKDAIEDYTQSILLDGINPFTYNARGIAYEKIGKYDISLSDLTKAITISPYNGFFYTNRGSLYQNMKNFKEALSDYNTSLELITKEKTKNHLNSINEKKTQELNTLILKTLSNRGFCHAREGNFDAAIRDLSEVITEDKSNLLARYNRGICFDKIGNHKQAIKEFSYLIEMDSRNSNAYFSRGSVFEKLPEYSKALDDYSVALALDVDTSELKDEVSLTKFKSEHRANLASQGILKLLKN